MATIVLSQLSEMQNNVNESNSKSPEVPKKKPVPTEVPKRRLPNVIIAGCAKCGSRALLRFLCVNPKFVCASSEVHYFDAHYENGVEWYRSFFPPRRSDQIGIEKSPSYWTTELVPSRIKKMNTSMRILVIVCEPVRKSISQYTQNVEQNHSNATFQSRILKQGTDEIDQAKSSIIVASYYLHLQRWLKYFPLDQIHFVDGDRFRVDPIPEIHKVETFLNIPNFIDTKALVFNKTKGFYCISGLKADICLGETKGRTHIDVEPNLKQKLADYFKPLNEKFMDAIGQRFNWNVWD